MLQQLHSVIIGTWSNGSRNSPTTAKTFLRLLSDVGMYLNEKWKLCVSKSAFFLGDALWVASCSVCFPAFPAPFMTDLLVLFLFALKSLSMYFLGPGISSYPTTAKLLKSGNLTLIQNHSYSYANVYPIMPPLSVQDQSQNFMAYITF